MTSGQPDETHRELALHHLESAREHPAEVQQVHLSSAITHALLHLADVLDHQGPNWPENTPKPRYSGVRPGDIGVGEEFIHPGTGHRVYARAVTADPESGLVAIDYLDADGDAGTYRAHPSSTIRRHNP